MSNLTLKFQKNTALTVTSSVLKRHNVNCIFFFSLSQGFLSQPFTNHRAAGEGGGHLFNSSLPLPPASQTFRH